MANATNQALLQAQTDFQSLTQTLINDFWADCAPIEEPVVDQIQQVHAATAQKDLLLIIKELRDEVQLLKNKESVDLNVPCKKQQRYNIKKPWQHYWTYGANNSHCSSNCNNPMTGH